MDEDLPVRRVEISFVGAAPDRHVARASGVSDVETDGSTLRCLVRGSFQPFLEALRGHEVVGFTSSPEPAPAEHLLARDQPGGPAGPASSRSVRP